MYSCSVLDVLPRLPLFVISNSVGVAYNEGAPYGGLGGAGISLWERDCSLTSSLVGGCLCSFIWSLAIETKRPLMFLHEGVTPLAFRRPSTESFLAHVDLWLHSCLDTAVCSDRLAQVLVSNEPDLEDNALNQHKKPTFGKPNRSFFHSLYHGLYHGLNHGLLHIYVACA